MDPFDEGYFTRREKQIKELYTNRAVSGAIAVVGLLGLLVVFFMRDATWAPFALLFSLMFLVAAFLILVVSTAESAADRAIQKEYERLMELYSRAGVKPKRDHQTLRLTDDGEIETDHLSQESPLAGRERRI